MVNGAPKTLNTAGDGGDAGPAAPGDIVVAHGLQNAPELNGQLGIVEPRTASNGRVTVRFRDLIPPRSVALRHGNLTVRMKASAANADPRIAYTLGMAELQKAGPHAVAGRWRECADAYRNALEMTNGQPREFLRRYYSLNGLFDVLTAQLRGQATAADHAVLKSIGRGKYGDHPEVQMNAEYARGLVRWDQGDRQGAARCYRRVLEIQAAATADDTRHQVITGSSTPESAAAVVERIGRSVADNLAILEQRSPPMLSAESRARAAREEATHKEIMAQKMARMTPQERRDFQMANSFEDDKGDAQAVFTPCTPADSSMLARCSRIRGAGCDTCGKLRDAAGKLNMCSRCKQRWYCSSACQKTAWPRHKLACRAPGKFRVGDVAVARDPTTTVGVLVTVTGPGPDGANGPTWHTEARVIPGIQPDRSTYPAAFLEYIMDDDDT